MDEVNHELPQELSFQQLSSDEQIKALLAMVLKPVPTSTLAKWIKKPAEDVEASLNALNIQPLTARGKLEFQLTLLEDKVEYENNLTEQSNTVFPRMRESEVKRAREKIEDIKRQLAENDPVLDAPPSDALYGDPRRNETLKELRVDPGSVNLFIINDAFSTIEKAMGKTFPNE